MSSDSLAPPPRDVPPPAALVGISRVWHGWTSPVNADAYERLLRTTILPGIAARARPGYHGAFLYRRDAGDEVEFVTTMLFAMMDDVRAFAGQAYDDAVVPAAARALLSRWDAHSAHYAVLLTPDRALTPAPSADQS